MSTVKLDLNNASVTDKLQDGTTILDSTETRTDLDPERTSYATAHAALAQAEKDLGEARQKARELKIVRDDRETEHDTAKGLLGSKVETVTKGDEAAIVATGFPIRSEASATAEVGAIEGFSLTAGDDDGELDAAWDRTAGVIIYEVATSDISDVGPWTHAKSLRASKVTLGGLKSGSRTWVRIRALGKDDRNPGPWSAPIAKRVP